MSSTHEDVLGHVEHPYNDIIEGELTFNWPQSHAIIGKECNAARKGVAIFDIVYHLKVVGSGGGTKLRYSLVRFR